MGREGVRETGTAYVVFLFPDVCLTPMGPSMVPVPYPVVGVFDNVALVAPSVRMRGRPTFTTASQVTRHWPGVSSVLSRPSHKPTAITPWAIN